MNNKISINKFIYKKNTKYTVSMHINVTCISKTENKRNFRKASPKKSQKLSYNSIKCIV